MISLFTSAGMPARHWLYANAAMIAASEIDKPLTDQILGILSVIDLDTEDAKIRLQNMYTSLMSQNGNESLLVEAYCYLIRAIDGKEVGLWAFEDMLGMKKNISDKVSMLTIQNDLAEIKKKYWRSFQD
jgi:hypothetical protein